MNQKRIKYLSSTLNNTIDARRQKSAEVDHLRAQKKAAENTAELSFKVTANAPQIQHREKSASRTAEKNFELMKRMADKRKRGLENS